MRQHHRIAIHYRPSWLAPIHPAHEEARRDTERWLDELGVLAGDGARRKLAALNVGGYGGWPFPFAPLDRLTTVTRFLTLWIFHDDVAEGLGAEPAHALGQAIRGEPRALPERGPVFRGWWELGVRFREAMSERWLERHAARFAAWFRSLDDEARLVAEARRRGRQPSVEEYLAVREINVGMYPTIDLVEYVSGRELDATLLADPDLAVAERFASRVVACQNDLIGYVKDEEHGWTNVVRSAAEEGGSLLAAFEHVARLHDAYADGLAAVGHRLARRHGDAARAWVRALQHVVAGLGQWHVSTPRYSVAPVLSGGERIEIAIETREPESVPSTPRRSGEAAVGT